MKTLSSHIFTRFAFLFILVFAFSLGLNAQSTTSTDTMYICRNGSAVAYAVDQVDSIVFVKPAFKTELQEGLVGVWKGLSTSAYEKYVEAYTQLKADGTYVDASYYDDDGFSITYGKWYVKGDILYITAILDYPDADGITVPVRIVKLDGNSLTVEFLGITATAVKVNESEMEAFIKMYEGMTP